MNLKSSAIAVTTALGLFGASCSTSPNTPNGTGGTGGGTGQGGTTTTGGSGGSTSTGGSSGSAGSGGMCQSSAPCGGSVVGTWNVQSSCLSRSGSLDLQATFGLTCPSGQVTGSLQVTGSWTANANGTFKDGTTTTGTDTLELPSACLILSGAKVTCQRIGSVMSGGYYQTGSCVDNPATGGCTCTGNINHMGSMGVGSSDPQVDANYATSGNTLTVQQDNSTYAYCVSGNQLTMVPQGSGPTTTGSVVLQSGASMGSGGAGGSASAGGAGGAGGSSGAGGSVTTGGSSGTGGSATGGSAGSGVTGGSAGMGGAGATGGSSGAGGSGGSGSTTRGMGPCDIYAAANMPCGAAYSMVRALSSKYTGPLYQVRNMSSAMNTGTGGMTKDITMTPDGYADSAVQDAFCMGTTCTVVKLYDQSGNGNDLIRGSKGPTGNGTRSGEDDYESTATKQIVTAGGHKTYALKMAQYEGYRTALGVTGKGIPTGNKDQGIYELVDGTYFGTQCCWDFGSVSPDPNKYVTMNTIFFGKGFWGTGAGSAPWFMGDFEGGVWAGGTGDSTTQNNNNPSMAGVNFALGILHTPVGKYALRMADISKATDLTTAWDGGIPSGKTWGNAGGIVLGVGGDNSNNSYGTFYEGAVTNGSPSNDTDLAVMKNIQMVGYKK